jgi:uncharacterized protein (TIGR00255 family)
MLLSMTGHGEARGEQGGTRVSAEIRSVNGRYFKLNFRCAEAPMVLESTLEQFIRESIRRGSVTLVLRIEQATAASAYRIRSEVITAYRNQLVRDFGTSEASQVPMATLLMLPGAVEQPELSNSLTDTEVTLIEEVVRSALRNLETMRQREGEAMARDMRDCSAQISLELETICERAPLVSIGYRERLAERLNAMLQDYPVRVTASDIVREVGLFAERTDISEEIVRLKSHLVEFQRLMEEPQSAGRKLDFLIQEMFREINTIGSKGNDRDISRCVVQAKNCIERMREMVQNVE